MPVVSGRLASKAEKASRPPAEAPIPTIGKTLSRAERGPGVVMGGAERLLRLGVERFFTGETHTAVELKTNGAEGWGRKQRRGLVVDTSSQSIELSM